VNRAFIAFSLAIAFLLNLMPWGDVAGVPDFVALTLLFWNIHQPRKVGIGIAFLLGVLMDVNNASLLGEHALAYTLLSYGAIMLHRRVLWFPIWMQTLHVLPLLLVAQLVPFVLHLLGGATALNWGPLFDVIVEALLWPLISILLLAPQRRATDPDDTRPI
jgi:rod shape-determining protein MreD